MNNTINTTKKSTLILQLIKESKERLVNQHVNESLSGLIYHLQQIDAFSEYEDIEDYYNYITGYCEYDSEEYTEIEATEKIEEIENSEEYSEEHKQEYIESLESIDFDQYPEIFEWWSVGSWFGDKLREQGEIVFEYCGLTIWARQCTGQAILLDYCISKIAESMGILEGQESS